MKTFLSCLTILLLLSACSFAAPTAIKQDSGDPQPSITPSVVQTTLLPTSLPLDVPAAGSLPPAASASNQPVGGSVDQMVQVFLVALEDGGISGTQIGCGDSLVPVDIKIQATKSVLRAAIQELLMMKEPYYGESGLYNALNQSELEIEDIWIEQGTANILLTGKVQLGGVCDNPRFAEQLKATAMQFEIVEEVRITVNGTSLEELLSQK